MQQQFTAHSVEDLGPVVDFLKEVLHQGDVVCLHGPMGAGKTTLVKAIATSMGVEEGLSSPSFGLVNEYEAAEEQVIFHFDLYRLNDPDELLDIGWYDYLDQEQLVFVEWPEKAEEYIPEDALHIFIEPKEAHRELTITY